MPKQATSKLTKAAYTARDNQLSNDYYIGLMSGTSLDGIDGVVVSFDDKYRTVLLHTADTFNFPDALKNKLAEVISDSDSLTPQTIGTLDRELGHVYAETVNTLLAAAKLKAEDILAVGCHGQTVLHEPDANPPFTMQLGDGASIAANTGVTTVNDFRRADIALGGQGAPLATAFHNWALADDSGVTVVVNIGGIGNVSILRPNQPPLGYDTGPGNTLLDIWVREHTDQETDTDGNWARSGSVDETLLQTMLADPYFSQPAPKSTGREYFHLDWLQQFTAVQELPAVDVQATLAELTAATIADEALSHNATQLWVCGGGVHNLDLIERIRKRLPDITVGPTDDKGIPADYMEAIAFAWLARARLRRVATGCPEVTGASHAAVQGAAHIPPGR